jgi:hypothetical protein
VNWFSTRRLHTAIGSIPETRGETYYRHAPDTGPRRTATRFVGYLGPSGFGLCAAKLI